MSKESKKYKNVALMSDSEKRVKTLEDVIVKQRTEIRILKEQLTLAEVSVTLCKCGGKKYKQRIFEMDFLTCEECGISKLA